MELVDEGLFDYSLNACRLRYLIVQSYRDNNRSIKEYISYDEFRLLIERTGKRR